MWPEWWTYLRQQTVLLYSRHKFNMWFKKYLNYRVKFMASIIHNLTVCLITLKLGALADHFRYVTVQMIEFQRHNPHIQSVSVGI